MIELQYSKPVVRPYVFHKLTLKQGWRTATVSPRKSDGSSDNRSIVKTRRQRPRYYATSSSVSDKGPTHHHTSAYCFRLVLHFGSFKSKCC